MSLLNSGMGVGYFYLVPLDITFRVTENKWPSYFKFRNYEREREKEGDEDKQEIKKRRDVLILENIESSTSKKSKLCKSR